jgi:CheY-like chemotaxis protein
MYNRKMEIQPKALVIEDYADQAIVFQRALAQAGFDTETFTNGALAQTRLAEIAPALIILDLHLPGVTGEIILKQIRGDQRLVNTRVIIATADTLLGQRLSADADLVLLKPISFRQLYQVAERYHAHPKT